MTQLRFVSLLNVVGFHVLAKGNIYNSILNKRIEQKIIETTIKRQGYEGKDSADF